MECHSASENTIIFSFYYNAGNGDGFSDTFWRQCSSLGKIIIAEGKIKQKILNCFEADFFQNFLVFGINQGNIFEWGFDVEHKYSIGQKEQNKKLS